MQQHEEYFRCPGFVCCLELSSLWPPLFLISAPASRDSTADSVWPYERNTSSPVDPFHSREIAKSTREADKSILATILAGRRRPFSSVMFQVTLALSNSPRDFASGVDERDVQDGRVLSHPTTRTLRRRTRAEGIHLYD